jgi:hypothetical protein
MPVRHPDWVPGIGYLPDVAALLATVDDAWNEQLEAAWASELDPTTWAAHAGIRHGNCPAEARIVARCAVGVWARQWGCDCGPEWAAAQGVSVEVVTDYLGRAPRLVGEDELYPPLTPDDVRDALDDGWLLAYWRRNR